MKPRPKPVARKPKLPPTPTVLAYVNEARAALATFENGPNKRDPYDIWRAVRSLVTVLAAVRPKKLGDHYLRRATDECLSWERVR